MKKFETPKITVAIRKRPLNKKQIAKGQTDIIKVQNRQSLIVSQCKQKVDLTKYIEETTFNFDYSFDENTTNEDIYQQSIRPLIDSAFEGAKISCFAYGQTGSGKTFTMKGDMAKGVPGLYYLAAQQIFRFIEHPQFQHLNILVSFYEIYCGKLYDLLCDRKELKIRQDKHANINIIGLQEKPIYSANEFLDIIEYGSTFRITSQNATNADSSRSHAIMQITIKDAKKVFSKVSFIDLAGNERGADHMDQSKQTKIDGAQINKSLLALKQCIRALDQGKGHTPFRGSKLTMVLKDSFVGFCKTVMIGNVSPNVSSSQNTLNTLRYADRVKQLKKPSQNLTKQQLQAKQLMLPRAANKNTVKVNIEKEDDTEQIQKKIDIAKKKNHNQMDIEAPAKQMPLNLQKRGTYKQSSSKDVMQGKKTDSNTSYRIQERKSPYNNTKQEGSLKDIKNNENINNMIQNGSKKSMSNNNGPLFQKNNNINTSNQDSYSKGKPTLHSNKLSLDAIDNMPLEQLNRQHFDAMNSLHSEFSKFKDVHSKLVKEETIFIRDEMMKLGQMSELEEFGSDAQLYLELVENSIESKLKLMNELRNQVNMLKKKKKDSQNISKVLENHKQQEQIKVKPIPQMEVEYPKPSNNLSSMVVNVNPMRYVYHSSTNQPQQRVNQHLPSSNNGQIHIQSHHAVQPTYQPYGQTQQNVYTYSNQTNFSQGPSINKVEGYQFSQYHQKNNYVPSLNSYSVNNTNNNYSVNNNNYIYSGQHQDEQLLQDLPGDEHMQRLF